ncbi:MAG TPA: nucleoside hydrolase [Candidatus Dormibacteraeota bacterium]|nr:nucleoside hydrolase [Candidatus Dormibacteraeota bacterium]
MQTVSKCRLWGSVLALFLCLGAGWAQTPSPSEVDRPARPIKLIFDTDIGNDVDDVMAFAMLHSLQSRKQCELLAVTITKPDELAGPFVDAMDTFYGHPGIPIGFTHAGLTNEPSKFLKLATTMDGGEPRFPHALKRSSDRPPATRVLRKTLAAQEDGSVVIVQVGFFSNLAALLGSAADEVSPLSGVELVKRKVRLLSIMAGAFKPVANNKHFLEYNVIKDIPAAQKVAGQWPTPIVWSGFEIGIAVPFPAKSIEQDFNYVRHHPVPEAYRLYQPPPHERPTWDLTSVLYAVFPERGYFDVSEAGKVSIAEDGYASFAPGEGGRDRFLILSEAQRGRVREAMVQLASEPPESRSTNQRPESTPRKKGS